MATFKYNWVKINGRWVKVYPNGKPTNQQRIDAYFAGVKRARAAAFAKACEQTPNPEPEHTAALLALVIAARPALDGIRKSVLALRNENNLPHAHIDSVINKYKEYLWTQSQS